MANSFINEHSAELIMVPQLGRILELEFKKVIPIFYWASREGSTISKKCLKNSQFRIICFYTRRPKITSPDQLYVGVKFNDLLFRQTDLLEPYGIPVFAGVPLVNSLTNFTLNTECAWFNLQSGGREQYLDILLDGTLCSNLSFVTKVGSHEICEIVKSNCQLLSWENAINCFYTAKRKSLDFAAHSLWGVRYKPVYFLLPEEY